MPQQHDVRFHEPLAELSFAALKRLCYDAVGNFSPEAEAAVCNVRSGRSMRILDRYILKEIVSHCFVGLLVFTFVLYVRPLGLLLELIARRDLSTGATLLLFLLPLPGILVLTVPMSVLVGTLIGLSRMSVDSEVTAIRAAGIGRAQFIRPVVLFALAGWLLTSWMSLSVAPRAAERLAGMEGRLVASQAAYEIRPRIFIERFPDLLLYIEDITGSHAEWHNVFIADTTKSGTTRVTLAKRGRLVNHPSSHQMTLQLEQGSTHEYDPQHPGQYSITSFSETDTPIERTGGRASVRKGPTTMSTAELWVERNSSSPAERREARVELNYRLALPVAALVLILVGIPIGLISHKGGRGYGLMLTILLVFVYYILMASGLSLAKQGRIDPVLGLWIANLVFAASGIALLSRPRAFRIAFEKIQLSLELLRQRLARTFKRGEAAAPVRQNGKARPRHGTLIRILDFYVIRGWCFYLVMLLAIFCGIYMIFDFFQLLGDIVRNHVMIGTVLSYYRYLIPQVVYLMLPLSILVATLVTFGLLTKWDEMTAMKAAGISLYRVAVPVMIAGGLLSGAMFLMGNDYLPQTNQLQDSLRNQIKGKPPQTTYRPDRQWIFGKSNRIYYYRFFDADQNAFANLSVFEFSNSSFHLDRRIEAKRAFWEPHVKQWVMEDGWVRDFSGDRVQSYMPFSVATFKELTEQPDYFKKEVKPSEQMSALELRRYIRELRQSGFDVVRLSIALYHKFSYPLIAFVVTLIGIPFAVSMGRRGALSGIALSIGIAIVFWSLSALFQSMGDLSQLPPAVAAWSPDVLFGLTGVYLLLKIRT